MPTTLAGFLVTQSNLSGFGSVSPDPNEPLAEPNPLVHILNTVYESVPFSVDLTISGQFLVDDVIEVRVPTQILSPTMAGNTGLRFTVLSSATIRIAGYHSFPGAGFFFKMYGTNVLASLPSDTTANYEALVRYNMPSPTSQLFNILLPIKFGSETHQLTVNQWAVWNYTSAAAAIKRLVASRA